MNPPAWLFQIVWTILYLLMIPTYILMIREKDMEGLIVFSLQLALNLAWIFLYFVKRYETLALIDLLLMWLITLWFTLRKQTLSHQLQLPYLVWLTFALYLSITP